MQSASSFRRLSPPASNAERGPSRRRPLWPARSWPIRSTSRLSAISCSSVARSCSTAWTGARGGTQRD
eukprot:5870333-Alexandrium_andersonii.AAC.1